MSYTWRQLQVITLVFFFFCSQNKNINFLKKLRFCWTLKKKYNFLFIIFICDQPTSLNFLRICLVHVKDECYHYRHTSKHQSYVNSYRVWSQEMKKSVKFVRWYMVYRRVVSLDRSFFWCSHQISAWSDRECLVIVSQKVVRVKEVQGSKNLWNMNTACPYIKKCGTTQRSIIVKIHNKRIQS